MTGSAFRAPLMMIGVTGLLAGALLARTTPLTADLDRAGQAPDSLMSAAKARMLDDLSILAHDSMQGRRTGTAGAARARRFLSEALSSRGLTPVVGGFEAEFRFRTVPDDGEVEAVNFYAVVPGTEYPNRTIVITAHYDHLGIVGGEVYNGADDNASGTAALLALAEHFARLPTRHTLLFAALDAEEMGLRGAREFIANPPVPLASIGLNINLDMVSRSEARELYAAGTHHYPFLSPLLAEVAGSSRLTLLAGHDTPDLPPGDDWTLASDHGPFHEAGIPFLYFGVEDHSGYHDPSDTFEAITPGFYIDAVETILTFVRRVDLEDATLWDATGRRPPP